MSLAMYIATSYIHQVASYRSLFGIRNNYKNLLARVAKS